MSSDCHAPRIQYPRAGFARITTLSRSTAVLNTFRLAALALAVGFAVNVQAAEITGAGATFIYPLLSKWSADYNKATKNKVNYQSIGSGGNGLSDEPKSTVAALICAMPPPEPIDW